MLFVHEHCNISHFSLTVNVLYLSTAFKVVIHNKGSVSITVLLSFVSINLTLKITYFCNVM